MSKSEPNVAIFVLNRNMRDMTERLIGTIRTTCKPRYTIFSLDAASDPEQVVSNGADCTVRFHENRRWAWSFARGMEIALGQISSGETTDGVRFEVDWRIDRTEYTHFWLLCNDTQLDPEKDTLGIMLDNMPNDACQIHPYQKTHPVGAPQGRQRSMYTIPPIAHNVAFVEFVCPLITRNFYDKCVSSFGCPPVGPHFPYGWGVDYEMAYFGHKLGLKSYICDAVGITHHPGTTHENHVATKVEDNVRMRENARGTMLDVLEQRYGHNWGDLFENAAAALGVDPKAFLEWSHYDRALSLKRKTNIRS